MQNRLAMKESYIRGALIDFRIIDSSFRSLIPSIKSSMLKERKTNMCKSLSIPHLN